MKEFDHILKEIKSGNYSPIYFIQGEEAFYIDKVESALRKHVLQEHEKDFNESIFYGKDTDANDILTACKRFPMMAEKQLIIVKEAQDLKNWEVLEGYFENPVESTVLFFGHKYKTLDKRKKIAKLLLKSSVFLTSNKLRDYELPKWISANVKSYGFQIADKEASILAEHVGSDLAQLHSVFGKLQKLLAKGSTIDGEVIQKHVGISKEYNVFELTDAVLRRDIIKTQKIIQYFKANPKAVHIIPVISNLYTLFTRLLNCHYATDKSPNGLMKAAGLNYYAAQQYQKGLQIYSVGKLVKNVSILREYDMKSKGLGAVNPDSGNLMQEMLFKLMH